MKGRKPSIDVLDPNVVMHPGANLRLPPCPDYMQGRSKDIWSLITRELVNKSIYDTDIRETVASYCIQFARFLDAEDKIFERGAMVKSRRIKVDTPNPYVSISNNAYDRMTKLAAELGLTAVSRKRVVKMRGIGSAAPASKFLKKASA